MPLVGGPANGRYVTVDLDEAGAPPDPLPQHELWVQFGSELMDVEMSGQYRPEPAAGLGGPWLYVWLPG